MHCAYTLLCIALGCLWHSSGHMPTSTCTHSLSHIVRSFPGLLITPSSNWRTGLRACRCHRTVDLAQPKFDCPSSPAVGREHRHSSAVVARALGIQCGPVAAATAGPAVHRGDAQAAHRRRQELADRVRRHHARDNGRGARPGRGAPVVWRLPGCHVHRGECDQAEGSRPRQRRPEWLDAQGRWRLRRLCHRPYSGKSDQRRPEWSCLHCHHPWPLRHLHYRFDCGHPRRGGPE